jgi:hypothetical protein
MLLAAFQDQVFALPLPESLAAIMQDPVFMGFTVISWHSINGNE